MTYFRTTRTRRSLYLLAVMLLALTFSAGAAYAVSGVVDVTVDISPKLKAKTKPDEVVFLSARAVKGPRAPVAVVRARVSDLPFTVRLDDSKAVAPFLRISNFDEVTLSARVSRSGGAMKSSGDLEGNVGPVKTETTGTPIRLTIDHVVP